MNEDAKSALSSAGQRAEPTEARSGIRAKPDRNASAIYFKGGKVFYNKSGGFAYVELTGPAPVRQTPTPPTRRQS
ncbi:MAG: hypothetical protein AAF748_01265 [Pseudomonadota bacterium]